MELRSIDQILEVAIQQEQAAYEMYQELAERAANEPARRAFLDFADEELGHKAKLEEIREGRLPQLVPEKVAAPQASEALDYQQALIVAMKAEQKAHDLYMGLAQAAEDESLADVLRGLAQEELKHKLRFESEYEEVVLEGN
jgi:rubrerythrin